MTSELHTPLTLADLIDKELMGVEPDSQCVVLDDTDWKMITAALRRYTIEFTRCVSCDGYNCDDGCAYPDTRAVPDVPELVRYRMEGHENTFYENGHTQVDGIDVNEIEDKEGEYVRHDQTEAVIAAKDKKAKSQDNKISFLIARAEAAEAKLAQIEKQESVDGFLMSDGVACVHQKYGEGLFFSDDALKQIYVSPIQGGTPQDVKNLVIAARDIVYGGHINVVGKEFDVLDKALEAFASRIDWEDQPEHTAPVASAPICFECAGELTVACLKCAVASDADLRADTIEQCRKAVRNAILRMPPEHRANGDICDDVIARALAALNPSEPRT